MGDVGVIPLVPGSVSIPPRPVCATWVGWLVDAGKPIVARNSDQDPAEMLWQGRKNGSGELGALRGEASKVRTGPTVVMCGHSERAMVSPSLLARAGRTDISVLVGRPQDWAEATGENPKVGA
jgi:hydroxyacylglutathione hydrolase